jgi:hypothetical protein
MMLDLNKAFTFLDGKRFSLQCQIHLNSTANVEEIITHFKNLGYEVQDKPKFIFIIADNVILQLTKF